MDEAEKKRRVKAFVAKWLAAEGRENGETQPFWLEFIHDILGAPREFDVVFEKPVKVDGAACRIDVFLPLSKVIIEQKGKTHTLDGRGSDGLTPFEQARNYAQWLPHKEHPRWIITCNFSELWIYDLDIPNPKPLKISLENLPKELHRLGFLTAGADATEHAGPFAPEVEVSVKAGEIVARIYESLFKSARNPDSPETLRSLNIFCVRLVFCLYAENAELFGPKQSEFRDYIKAEGDARQTRRALMNLFKILNTPEEKRDPYLREENPRLAAFPYANGGLFADVDAEVPMIDEATRHAIIDDASAGFNWSGISPTIFGAVFESTLNPETRRKGGMHYTSPANIHKVIDPLFLNDLKAELDKIEQARVSANARTKMLLEFQEKLAKLKFLDPACGSGNFLTETFLSLRRLENRAIKLRLKDQMVLSAIENPVRVSISQFYGIEINDFAAVVAKTAMWIAENQMLAETKEIIGREIEFLPLKSYANVAEGNALKMDWSRLEVESGDLWHAAQIQAEGHAPRDAIPYDYIFGNPPFVGYSLQSKEQKADMEKLWRDEHDKPYKMAGKIDYVTAWFFKATSLIKDTRTRCAFVATNSIAQGDQVAAVWKPLRERFGVHIDFAHRAFRWDSESNDMAHVHCVVVGFSSTPSTKPRILFDGDRQTIASNINAYLIDAPDVFVERRTKPLCKVPEMTSGNRPTDGGHLILEADEYEEFLKKEPSAEKFVKKFLGAEEFLNNKKRWCLWLVGASPNELRAMPEVMKHVELCKQARASSPDAGARKLAETPMLFREQNNPESYVVVPATSSEKRRYVPLGFCGAETISSNALLIIPDATLFHFGVLTSDVHMAWMRIVAGRLETRYRYSAFIVYNNFPWASADEEQIQTITATAQGILDARAKFPDSTLADLYDELTMPKELRDAHVANDRAVRKLFGFSQNATEPEIVRELFQRYSVLANGK